MAACEVAIDMDLHGPVTASALACASGNYAVLEARRLILAGEAGVVLAGGTDAEEGAVVLVVESATHAEARGGALVRRPGPVAGASAQRRGTRELEFLTAAGRPD